MKVYELLGFHQELLEKLYAAGINTCDYKYVELYHEYVRLKKDGLKVAYIIAYLSEQYSISERKIYNVIKKLEDNI